MKQMVLDFSKLGGSNGSEKILEPRKIFTTLRKKDPRYNYPRDVQSQVWEKWYQRRDSKDLVLKMNTGSGKTVVGLVLLQSCLNEGIGSAVYVAPDNYLVKQVLKEAENIGIAAVSDEEDAAFVSGGAILVINIKKLINGKSVFGVGSEGRKIEIGAIVIDDAHSCLASVKEQFTLSIPGNHPAFIKLLKIFEDDLKKQSAAELHSVQAHDPLSLMRVPFWAWQKQEDKVIETLHPYRNADEFKFIWPLVAPVLSVCECVFGAGRVEISPRCLPIDLIQSFQYADRRIYMTATLADDGVLVTEFNADPNSISEPIIPNSTDDLGDRMILLPQEINSDISFEDIRKLASKFAKNVNVVVIVPSKAKASYWEQVADQILYANNIDAGIAKLRKGRVGLTVLVNKYDGVDLPDDACRLLVIHGTPEVSSLFERVEASALDGTESAITKQIQRIEQGMGRGVRSNEDYCAVILIGSKLSARLHKPVARSKFTAATNAQVELSKAVMKQLIGKKTKDVEDALKIFLRRDPNWVAVSKAALVSLSPSKKSVIDPITIAQRKAFDFARIAQYAKASSAIQAAANSANDARVRGWLKEQLASYINRTDPTEAQEILLAALGDNIHLIRPIEGVKYSKLRSVTSDQAVAASKHLERYLDPNDLLIELNSLMDDLIWLPDTSDVFEAAIFEVGKLIGFSAQRPEADTGDGPDDLWALGGLTYLVIECKNGVTTESVSKRDANQLAGSMNWFMQNYDESCKGTPTLIHPSNIFAKNASPEPGTRVINDACLKKLKDSLAAYGKAVAGAPVFGDSAKIRELLHHHRFTRGEFLDTYSVPAKCEA